MSGKMKLGSSQKVVIRFMQTSGPIRAQQLGDTLYKKISACARYGHGTGSMGGRATPEEIRRNWAAKLLNELKKKGLADFQKDTGVRVWFLTQEGKNL